MHHRTRSRVGWILGLGLAVTAVIVGVSLFLQTTADDDRSGGGSTGTVPPMVPPTGEATGIPADRIVVTATSFLAPDGDITYEPGNVVDDDIQTAWNSDNADDQGRGESLTFRFTEPVDLQRIQFINGYAKSADIFAANHRIRDLSIETDEVLQVVSLQDTSDLQEVAFDFGFTSKVVIEVIEVYPGAGFDNPALTADLALTEVEFVAVQR